jgi:signal peptidase II
MKRVKWLSALIIFTLIADQVTKYLVRAHFFLGDSKAILDSIFSLTYVRNPGVAFGFLATAPDNIRRPVLLAIPLIACVWLGVLIWQNRKSNNWILGLAYALIFSGAMGNLIDRFFLGYVVDFFDFYWGDAHFPAFNIADSCKSIAAALLILDFLLELKKNKKKETGECCPR